MPSITPSPYFQLSLAWVRYWAKPVLLYSDFSNGFRTFLYPPFSLLYLKKFRLQLLSFFISQLTFYDIDTTNAHKTEKFVSKIYSDVQYENRMLRSNF